MLIAENFAALDPLFPMPVIKALARGLDQVAARLKCDRIRFICRETDRSVLQALREMGNGSPDGVMLTGKVSGFGIDRAA